MSRMSPRRAVGLSTLIALTAAALPASAHVSYSGRDFNTAGDFTAAPVTIANQAVTGNFGWADAADADFGDSHRARWYRFTLAADALVTVSASAKADATATSVGGLLPGFSLYAGLAHASPADYDTAAITRQYLIDTYPDGAGGTTKEGAWNALGSFRIGNDDAKDPLGNAIPGTASLSLLGFVGHAVDGSAANFGSGTAAEGDGLADGSVTRSFLLAAGSYTLIVGGANYADQTLYAPYTTVTTYPAYGVAVTLSAAQVPEPASAALMACGIAAIAGLAARRPRAA